MRQAIGLVILGITAIAAAEPTIAFHGVFTPAKSLQAEVQQALSRHVGATVLVRSAGKTLLKETYGSRKIGTADLVTPSTLFRLAAATKPFTATAVLQLAAKQELQLTDPVSAYVDDLPIAISVITIKQLLTHQSGLPQYWTGLERDSPPQQPDGESYYTDANVLAWLRTDPELEFSPGTSTHYIDTNYVLLGLVIEAVTGQPFEQALRALVLQPASMPHAGFLSEAGFKPGERAYGHNRIAGVSPLPAEEIHRFLNDPTVQALGPEAAGALVQQLALTAQGYGVEDQSPYSRMRGDGCLYASIEDLEAWFVALETGVFDDEVVQLMQSTLVDADGKHGTQYENRHSYTCGWLRDKVGDEFRLTNPGATRGFGQTVQWLPTSQTVVAVLTNTDGEWEIDAVGEKLLRLVAKEIAQPPASGN
ncbi:serine hydrolase domain-containing protein [Botrimarina hoheduenensis]|uniref:Putative penicillin-binding protein PbpX n=1 Tax=Botrimarina hoheduenensis TaxID=2528000 RepID=A0A5C5VXQ9_9BACT|nr:serine hydrolase domain-containing protein [Botrimarina hoheduenensis]TWT42501.1 putative penicillin-binding protein PbpX [Botrimarina hoheduenensis]